MDDDTRPAKPSGRPSRRAVLAGAAGLGAMGAVGAAGVGLGFYEGWLPGRVRLRLGYWMGLDGDPVPKPSTPAAGEVRAHHFASPHRPGADEAWAWSCAPGTEPQGLPVVIVLHGWGDDHRYAFDMLGMHHTQAALVAEGAPPFVLASLDGGLGYWHERADGTDWAWLVVELLAELEGLGADTTRVGLTGWSMGGYGALRLATHELCGRVRAVGAMSSALFPSWENCPQGDAFDSPADFEANGMASRRERELLRGLPLHLACGLADPYWQPSRQLAEELEPHGEVETLFVKGDHTANLWRKVVPAQLRFITDHF